MAASNRVIPLKGKIQENGLLVFEKRKWLVKRTHKTDQERPWNHTDWINRGRDIQSQRYFRTAESAFSNHFWSTLKGYNCTPYIILNKLFKLFSAVGSVSRINKIGKIPYVFGSFFWIYGQKPLCEMGILKFRQNYESFKMPQYEYWSKWYQPHLYQSWRLYRQWCDCTKRLHISADYEDSIWSTWESYWNSYKW